MRSEYLLVQRLDHNVRARVSNGTDRRWLVDDVTGTWRLVDAPQVLGADRVPA